jgi:mRNA interferase MazF
VVVAQGDVLWAAFADPLGSGPGYRRPVVVVQGDSFNATRLATTIVVPLTSSLKWAASPGNVLLPAARTGLPRDSVANVSQITSVDRTLLAERTGHLTAAALEPVLSGIEFVLGRA